jgi:phosphomannomutase/phosphoglucomutase
MIKPPSTRDSPTTRPKRKVVFIGVCVLIATLLVYGIFEFRQRMGVARHQEQVVANQKIVEDLARQLSAELEPHRAKLKALAQKPSIVSALSADKVTRAKAALAEQSAIPTAALLRLLPRGAIQVDLDSKPPLTFASVDMLHRAAESDKDIGVELHLSGTDNEHLVMIQRVPLRGAIVGFLHLSLNSDEIKTAIVRRAPTTGKVEVRQSVPKSAPLIVAKSGTVNGDFPAVISEIDGTKWVVSFRSWGSDLETKAELGVGRTAMVMIALLGVVFFVVFFTNRRNELVMSSAVIYQGAIRSILEGAHPDLEKILPGVFGPGPVEFDSTAKSSDGRGVVTRRSRPRERSDSEDVTVADG